MSPHPENPRSSDTAAPERSKALLEEWVREFREQEHGLATSLTVAFQDGSDGEDSGLVIVHLENVSADIYIQPRAIDDPGWEATLTSRGRDVILTPYELAGLAAELVVAGNLCTFLQFKSLDWDRASGTRAVRDRS